MRIWLSPQNLEQARYQLNHLLLPRLFMSHHIFPQAKFQRFEEIFLKSFCVTLLTQMYWAADQYYQFLVLRNDQIDISGAGNFLSVDRTRGWNYTIKTDVSSNFLIFFTFSV